MSNFIQQVITVIQIFTAQEQNGKKLQILTLGKLKPDNVSKHLLKMICLFLDIVANSFSDSPLIIELLPEINKKHKR